MKFKISFLFGLILFYSCNIDNNKKGIEKQINSYEYKLQKNIFNNIDSIKFYSNKILNLSKENKFKKGIAKAYHYKAFYHYSLGNNYKAIQYYDSAIVINQNKKNYDLLAKNYNRKGIIYKNLGDYPEALRNYIKSYNLIKTNSNKEELISIFNSLGVLNSLLKNYNRAVGYFKKSLAISKEYNHILGQGNAYNNIGECYYKIKKYDLAESYYFKVLSVIKPDPNIRPRNTYHNLGDIYLMKNQLTKAKSYYNKSIAIKKDLKDNKGLAITTLSLANIDLIEKDTTQAIKKIKETIKIAQNINSLEQLEPAYLKLAQIYKQNKNLSKAFYYLQKYQNTSSQLINKNKNRFITLQQIKLESKIQKQENKILKEQNSNMQLWIIFAMIICFLVTILLFALYQNTLFKSKINEKLEKLVQKRTREVKEKNKLLQTKNQILEKVNKELDAFIYSTSHDLRAPIATSLGLINLMEDENVKSIDEMKKYVELQKKSLTKLDEYISEVLEYSRTNTLEIKIEQINFEKIIEGIFSHNNIIYSSEKIEMFYSINNPQNVSFHSDTTRLKIILNNLVSNALKYHNKYREKAFIKVKIDINKNTSKIEIEDNGQGIKKEHLDKIFNMFYRANESIKGTGLGLYIVKENLEKIKGEIFVKSHFGEGSMFILEIPNSVYM